VLGIVLAAAIGYGIYKVEVLARLAYLVPMLLLHTGSAVFDVPPGLRPGQHYGDALFT
jgi:hypothetical protein